jgi:hypothetical protein
MPSGSIALRTKEEDCDDDIAGKQFSACGPFFFLLELNVENVK